MQIKLSPILTDKEIFQLMALLRAAKRVAICGHYGPDGDAVGAALGWAAYLKHLGKQVTIVMPNPFPDFLTWLPGSRQILFNTFQHERVAKALSGLMRFVSWIASPIVWLLAKSTAFCTRVLRIKEHESKVTEDEIKSMIEEGMDEGEVSPVEQDIVERVFTLGDLTVSTIMTLRDDIVWLDLEMSEADIIKTIENTIFEQYPVVDGDMDHVAGVLSIKDYLAALRSGGKFDLRKMMKEPHYVHENMSVYAVLEYMKSERIHRALVCDEFGGLSGIISLKDIFDALVGNMNAQEHMKEPDIVPRKDGDGWFVDGQCSMYDFLTHFGLDENIEEYNFSTVGGLLLENLEHVPKSGEGIEWEGFSFEVADMDGARIDKVIVKKLADKAEDA